MSITPQERELVIIGAAVGSGCKTCIRQDMHLANQLHVTDTDIQDAIAVAIDIRRCATNEIENFVSSGLVDSIKPKQSSNGIQNPRNKALVSISAAFAVNCVSSLKEQITAAKEAGIDEKDLDAAISLSSFIKAMATSHVERLINPNEYVDDLDTLAEYGTPFGPERCAWAKVCQSEAAQSSSAGDDNLIKLTGAL
jgi:AhpD family alkylhydroperoxidase